MVNPQNGEKSMFYWIFLLQHIYILIFVSKTWWLVKGYSSVVMRSNLVPWELFRNVSAILLWFCLDLFIFNEAEILELFRD